MYLPIYLHYFYKLLVFSKPFSGSHCLLMAQLVMCFPTTKGNHMQSIEHMQRTLEKCSWDWDWRCWEWRSCWFVGNEAPQV